MTRIRVVVPGPLATISGGYIYDRRIIAGLRDAGHDVDACAPDAIAAEPAGTRFVIDSLAIPAFGEIALPEGAIGLIHHPTALETSHDEAARDILRAFEIEVYARLAKLIATSDATAKRLADEFRVPADKIAVVVPGTDAAPRASGSGGPGCAILSVGTLIPRKGHDLLLRALARLFDLDWHLTIVGSFARDPVHAEALRHLAEEKLVAQRVRYVGEADDAALDDLWHHSDLFALATHFEGYGMAVAEALKRGIPPVVTNGGAAGALITPEAGAVCPVDDRDQLSKTLRRLIFDTALRRDMADAAWEIGKSLPDWASQTRAFARELGV